ncbi:MAG: ABC transporter substrate-binding protein [Candidatus Velthaea sp.]
MGKLRLSLACWDYDRTRALADGRVSAEGIDLVYQSLPVEETFFRMARFREFDVAEMSLSSYLVSKFRDDPFVAIPIFPSRFFRHSCIYVNERSGIREPQDLIGKTVGVPEYQMTAPAWIRGILSDEYGVPVESARYRSGGEEQPNREEKLRLDLPARIDLQPIGPGQTLSNMLESGEIDALHTARMPSCYARRAPGVKRLFEDYVPVERAYYEKTGIFPIMHTVVIRRELYERDRWIAMALAKAFARAQAIAYADLRETAALKTMLPWSVAEAERTRALMGDDFWPYGFAANEKTLDVFTRYSFEQGLSKRKLAARELFAPETLETFVI